jgi:predicted nucleotidyltransferase
VTHKDFVKQNTILHVTVGSQLTGTNLPGTSDNDEFSIYVEDKSSVYGMSKSFDHLSIRTQPEGQRSGSEDTDNIAYSLRKYLWLAISGNPSVLLPIFAPDDMIIKDSDIGEELRRIRYSFLSQKAVHKFLGYMHAQHERMMGQGKRNRVPKRPELIDAYGYDTKYAAHSLRLAIQGFELINENDIFLPMKPEHIELILAVREGKLTLERVSELVSIYEKDTRWLLENSNNFPPEPNFAAIDEFSIWAHEYHWEEQK